ncbi:MAG TPA: glycerophosphodiester phosphodiesterase [Terriglobales bacterium]|nr:glycerophosphodiester phosphodiesterase [Terriglobales bacterium]
MNAAPTRPLRLGHRGARKQAPENTFQAFDLALAHGCDGFEFDVRFTRDGRAVLCHDPKLKGAVIAECGYNRLCEAAACMVPCLEDVLSRYGKRAYLDIEIKVAGCEERVLRALREAPPERGYVVTSFQPDVLTELRRLDAKLPLGFISERRDHLAAAEGSAVQTMAPNARLLDRPMLDRFHARGRQVFVWTVNRRDDMLRFAEMGVDAIISDDTELLGSLWR